MSTQMIRTTTIIKYYPPVKLNMHILSANNLLSLNTCNTDRDVSALLLLQTFLQYAELYTTWISRWGSFVVNSSVQQPSTCHKPTIFHATQTVTDCSGTSQATRSRYPIIGTDRPLGFQEVEAPRISRQSAHEGGTVVSPTHQLL